MTTKVKAASAGEFLALVPAMLGYNPVDSVVIVVFDGKMSRGAMRFDMPRDRTTAAQIATVATGLVCKVADATGLALIVYGDPGLAEHIGSDLSEQAQSAGLHVVDALVVSDGRWARIGTGDELVELDAVPDQFSEMVAAGDQSSGAELPEPDAGLAAAVAARLAVPSDPLGPGDLLALFEDVRLEPIESLSAHDWAGLVWCLARPALRDVALMQWAGGQEAGVLALEAQLAWEEGTEYPRGLARVMWGEGARPDPKRLERALAVCLNAAALAPTQHKPGALASAAWLAWSLGRSTHADTHAEHAQRIDPEHGLAEIVRTMVAAGHLPEWAFVRA